MALFTNTNDVSCGTPQDIGNALLLQLRHDLVVLVPAAGHVVTIDEDASPLVENFSERVRTGSLAHSRPDSASWPARAPAPEWTPIRLSLRPRGLGLAGGPRSGVS